jgi:hypothetical protein
MLWHQELGDRMLIRKSIVGLILLMLLLAATSETTADDLTDNFANPPYSSKPWVYWYWMQANATKAGITEDLEAMSKAGIGGAYLMPIGHQGDKTIVKPPANPLSEHWWELVVHATKEADRLGMRLAMNACDGWALAGGPWITPDMSMQQLVTTSAPIDGGKPFEGKLAQPTTRSDYYRDIAVLAYPALEGSGVTSTQLKPKATTNIANFDPKPLVTGAERSLNIPAEGWIQFEFAEPFTCRSIKIMPDQRSGFHMHRAEVLVSDDGKKFRSLGRLKPTEFHGWQDGGFGATHAIEPTTARFFRFVLDRSGTPSHSENCEGTKVRNRGRLSAQHIELRTQPAINHWEGKAGFRWRRGEWTTEGQCPSELCVKPERIVDVTDKMDAEGVLRWTPPAGKWTIQRIGYTTTDIRNGPGGTGSGLECDKFNPKAAEVQFNGWFGAALKRVGPELAGKAMWINHTDSWEATSQNWSPLFRAEFIKRRGYDPLKWLLTMCGVPVESAELSERFLYDVRHTISDLVCDNFYEPFSALGREQGAAFSAEGIAPTMMADGMQHFRYVDFPMGEFWLNGVNQDKPNDIADAISGGHIYGKRIIGAEAFTQIPMRWNEDPYLLKPMGDYNMAKGINRFILHVWAHQAFPEKPGPGVTLEALGTFFSGTQTWHRPGLAWFDYVRRCSAMLQQGLPVVDVCYFTGEEQPSRAYLRRDLPLPLAEGYSFGSINRDALLTLAAAKDGRLVLPEGMSYRMLVLPKTERMTPELATKIGELAEAGVPIIGPRPTRSISLADYPKCDEKLRQVVVDSWKSVRSDATTGEVLDELGLSPDVEFPGVDLAPVFRAQMEYTSPPLCWNHRRTDEADIYFLSNQERRPRDVDVVFRTTGRVPERWDPATGTSADVGVWREEDGRTVAPIRFAPAGSVFVVFRRNVGDADPVARITPSKTTPPQPGLPPLWVEGGRAWASSAGNWKLTRQSGKTKNVSVEDIPAPQAIDGPWSVTFPPERGAPEKIELAELRSLGEHEDAGVKHFSGTATYSCTFELKAKRDDERLFLDLGRVANLAGVTVNGKKLATLWKPPMIVEVTEALRPGKNTLTVAVTNTWRNRLIGDASLPAEKRIGWSLFRDKWFAPNTPLDPAGLLGPVNLRIVRGY